MLLKKWLLGSMTAVLLVAVSACGGSDEAGEASNEESAAAQEQKSEAQGPQADLEDVPDVVAEVNGEEIGKDEFAEAYEAQFQQMAQQSQASGQEVDQGQLKKQVVESMISTELLVQEADQRNFSASDEDVDKMLQGLAQQNGVGSVDEFMVALEQQGMDRKEVQSQVRTQIQVEQLVEDEAGNLEPTQKETRALYEQMAAQQEQAGGKAAQKVPAYKKLRPQLEEQLKSQEMATVAKQLVGDLRKDADVVVNL